MDQKNTSLLVIGFVAILLGSILVSQAAAIGNKVTSLTIVDPETVATATAKLAGNNVNASVKYTLANAPTGWKLNEAQCNIVVTKVTNGTTTFTPTTDYAYTSAGVINLVNSTAVVGSLGTNSTYVTYSYCGDDYVTSSFGRTGIQTSFGLFGIAILLAGVGMFFGLAKNNGIFEK
jgi:hypothetical protein